MKTQTQAFWNGYEAKRKEITDMGFDASRDKFNQECPVGQAWTGSAEGLEYCRGEFQALADTIR